MENFAIRTQNVAIRTQNDATRMQNVAIRTQNIVIRTGNVAIRAGIYTYFFEIFLDWEDFDIYEASVYLKWQSFKPLIY